MKAVIITESGKFIELGHITRCMSLYQALVPFFHDCGQFYWLKTELFMKVKSLLAGETIYFELSQHEVQDIDTPRDWEIAEVLYKCSK